MKKISALGNTTKVRRETSVQHDFLVSRKHVSVRKSLMATQSHDVGLNVRCKFLNIVRKDLAMFLALSPVRTIFMEVCHKPVLITKSESVSSVVWPSDVHG
jgi:hypothetical protein